MLPARWQTSLRCGGPAGVAVWRRSQGRLAEVRIRSKRRRRSGSLENGPSEDFADGFRPDPYLFGSSRADRRLLSDLPRTLPSKTRAPGLFSRKLADLLKLG